jgi:hypothetical protein
MIFKQRLSAFVLLGEFFNELQNNFKNGGEIPLPIQKAYQLNSWFTPENTYQSLQAWHNNLTEKSLQKWLNSYSITEYNTSKNIMVIAAGNLPLVAFHDILSVLILGHKLILKQASDDKVLNKFVLDKLIEIEPEFAKFISYSEVISKNFDAVIATGSNNSARYFEQYFGKKPNIIRRNRNSIAVLKDNETPAQLAGLAQDITQYFGLGCRSISKLFVPENYNLNKVFEALFPYKEIINHNKYANNYDYHRAIFMLNRDLFTENGFVIMRENEQLASPVSVLHYQYYKNILEVEEWLNIHRNQIQCVVGEDIGLPFGTAQNPGLSDYADGVDTLQFLLNLD